MGQQQLLLIALGIIIVSLTVVAGINIFYASAVEANRDGLVMDLALLANEAQEFYRKESEMGGGGGSFVDFSIPAQLDTNANGTYKLMYVREDRVLIRGTGVEDSGEMLFGCSRNARKVTHEILVYPDEVQARKVY